MCLVAVSHCSDCSAPECCGCLHVYIPGPTGSCSIIESHPFAFCTSWHLILRIFEYRLHARALHRIRADPSRIQYSSVAAAKSRSPLSQCSAQVSLRNDLSLPILLAPLPFTLMTRSADLIQSNSQVYRIYSRRLSNPADPDIFVTAARKLTIFLSDKRAYYAEAQQPVRP